MYTLEQLQGKNLAKLKEIGWQLNVLPEGDRRCRQSWIDALVGVNPPLLQLLEVSPGVEVDRTQEPIIETVEASPAAEAEQVQELPLESKFGRIVYPRPAQEAIVPVAKTSPGVEVDRAQDAIAPVTKNLPGSRSKASTAHQLLELFQSRAHILEDSPGVKTEAVVSESAIAQAAKTSPGVESDQNPILTGLTFSAGFLARYSPPQPEIIHFQSDADGQLSLLDFEVESVEEPPDPDDFESLDAFREAIARWDWEHPSSFDHCSDQLPSSVHSEPPDPDDFDSMFAFWAAYDAWDEATDDDSKPLEISLDSFCEWAPCPADWYEPAVLLEPSKVLEVSPVRKSSITSDFFIPTFDAWCDRSNRRDEPPDTGIFARLPKPKPPNFPAQASWTQVGHKLDTSWTQVGHQSAQVSSSQSDIPKLFHRLAAGSSTQPARSPPGGDAMP